MLALVASVRTEIAEFLESLIFVYVLLIIAYIVTSLVFSFGLRIPYSRPLNAVLEFLRDVAEPCLRIFRRLPLRIGPLDLTPDRRDPRAADRRRDHRGASSAGEPGPHAAARRRAWRRWWSPSTRRRRRSSAARSSAGTGAELLPFLDLVNVRNTGVAFGLLADGGRAADRRRGRGADRAARVRR